MRAVGISFFLFPVFLALGMPSLTGVQPLAITPGKSIEVTLHGDQFTNDLRLWISCTGKVEFIKRINAKQAVFRITAAKILPGQVVALRVHDRTGLSGPILMMIDPLPTITATSTDKSKPRPLKLPIAVDGKMAGVNSHWFSFAAKSGKKISIEVVAERIASKADPMIRLFDPSGREVNFADDDDVLGSDAGMIHTAKTTGQYVLELRDVKYRSGNPFRLRLGQFPIWPKLKAAQGDLVELEPNNNPQQATSFVPGRTLLGNIESPGARDHFRFSGKKNQHVSFRADSHRIGSPAFISLALLDAAGKSIATASPGNLRQTILRHRLPTDGAFTLRAEELLRRGGSRFAYRIETRSNAGEFELRLKADKTKADRFWGIPGQKIELNLQAGRFGYEGPITLKPANGWVVEGNIFKAKAKDLKLRIAIPKNAQPGELHHLNISGHGEKTKREEVSLLANLRQRWPHMAFPPMVLQSQVPVAVIEPARVTLAAAKLKPGAKVKVRVTVRRAPPPIGQKAAPQAITIELKNLPAGVNVPANIKVEAKKDFVEFELTATADARPAKAEVLAIAKSKYRGVEWTLESPPVVFEILTK